MPRWFYYAQNLWVDKNIDDLESVFRRAAKAGYTQVLLTDSKFAKLGDMDAHYFANIGRVKKLAAELHLEIVPAMFPIGYSNDVYHEPPLLHSSLPDGTRLRLSYYHGVTVYDDQAMICPSEPRTVDLLRDQARRMHAAWGAKGYMMSHDEIRVLNWCAACERRHLDAGALLADNVRTCARLLREVNPGGRIYVWSDMFDPNHNAHKDYYLVRGDLERFSQIVGQF